MDLGLDQFTTHIEKLAKLPKHVRMVLFPIIGVGIIAGYVYFLYMPAQKQLGALQDQQLQLQRKLNEVRSVAANIEKFEAEIAGLEKKLTVALRQLPNSKELPVLLTDVSSLGKNAGLEFKSFRPRDEIPREFYAEVPIDIEFTGAFHDVAMFFDEVSRLPRIVNVGELDVSIGREDALATVLSVRGQASTFRFLEEDEVAAAPSAAGHVRGRR